MVKQAVVAVDEPPSTKERLQEEVLAAFVAADSIYKE